MDVTRLLFGRWLHVTVGCLCFVSAPACANMVIPSMVQVVAAPIPFSLALFRLPLMLQTLALVSAVEAAIVVLAARKPLWRVFVDLFCINAITSVAGLLMDPGGSPLWPGILWAYALTSVLEAAMLLIWRLLRSGGVVRALALSLAMNAASYAIIGVALYTMLKGPYQETRDQSILQRVSGRLVSDTREEILLGQGDARVVKDSPGAPQLLRRQQGTTSYAAVSPDLKAGLVIGAPTSEVRELSTDRLIWRWTGGVSSYPSPGLSNEGRKVIFRGDDGGVFLADTRLRRLRPIPGVEHASSLAITADGARVAVCEGDAITIVDTETLNKDRIEMAVKGPYLCSGTWSPDGGYLALAGNFNPYTAGNVIGVDVTIIDTRTRRWARLPMRVDDMWTQHDVTWVQ